MKSVSFAKRGREAPLNNKATFSLKRLKSRTPPEPILIPKLRIHFADFPYLHCSTN